MSALELVPSQLVQWIDAFLGPHYRWTDSSLTLYRCVRSMGDTYTGLCVVQEGQTMLLYDSSTCQVGVYRPGDWTSYVQRLAHQEPVCPSS